MQSSTSTRSYERLLDSWRKCRVGIAYGLGIDEEGRPQVHARNKLLKLGDMLNSGEVQRGIIAVGSRYEASMSTLNDPSLKDSGLGNHPVYQNNGKGFVHHHYRIQNRVDRWKREGRIHAYAEIELIHITHDYARERLEFDAGWVIEKYKSRVVVVEDGRPKEVIRKIDESQEPMRMKTDKRAFEISSKYRIRPDVAFFISGGFEMLKAFIEGSFSTIAMYGKRFLPGRK